MPIFQLPIVNDVPHDHITITESDLNAFVNYRHGFLGENVTDSLGFTLSILLHSTIRQDTGRVRKQDALLDALEQSSIIVRLVKAFRLSTLDGDGSSGGDIAFDNICFRLDRPPVNANKSKHGGGGDSIGGILPRSGCLALAPSVLWGKNESTILSDHPSLPFEARLNEASVGNLRDLLFGLPWLLTGLPLLPFRYNQCVVSFAVTLVFNHYNPEFISGLRNHLLAHFPDPIDFDVDQTSTASVPTTASDTPPRQSLHLVWYRGRSYLTDYAPLMVVYTLLVFYLYFSVSKLEMVKSKLGLAFGACFAVLASLLTSLSLCISTGLAIPTLNGTEIFPYVVVVIGFENIIVITKSVVATPIDLPVKHRIAQGLSKESWSILQHHATLFTLLGLGFLTLQPALQELCVFCMVSLCTDFFIRLAFFVPILSIDIRRVELSELQSTQTNYSLLANPDVMLPSANFSLGLQNCFSSTSNSCQTSTGCLTDKLYLVKRRLCDWLAALLGSLTNRFTWIRRLAFATSRFSRRLNRFGWLAVWVKPSSSASSKTRKHKASAAQTAAFMANADGSHDNVPRRLYILRALASLRPFQRLIMLSILLILIAYVAFSLQLFTSRKYLDTPKQPSSLVDYGGDDQHPSTTVKVELDSQPDNEAQSSDYSRLFTVASQVIADTGWVWNYLAYSQWPLLAKHYNFSLAGRHLALLEPIHLHYRAAGSFVASQDGEDEKSSSSPTSDVTHRDRIRSWLLLLSDWFAQSTTNGSASSSSSSFTNGLDFASQLTDLSVWTIRHWYYTTTGRLALASGLLLALTVLMLASIQCFRSEYSDSMKHLRNSVPDSMKCMMKKCATVWSAGFLSHGRLVAGCVDGSLELWDCSKGTFIGLMPSIGATVCWQHSTTPSSPQQGIETSKTDAMINPGGVTCIKTIDANSFILATSRGFLSYVNLDFIDEDEADPPRIVIRTSWHCQAHQGLILHLHFTRIDLSGIGSEVTVQPSDRCRDSHVLLIVSCDEEGVIVFTSPSSMSPLKTISIDHTSIQAFSFLEAYLRLVNPWTCETERLIHLLPPSTSKLRCKSSSLLNSVLTSWAKELAPIGVVMNGGGTDGASLVKAYPLHDNKEDLIELALRSTPSSSKLTSAATGSVLISSADKGQTLVIIPLSIVQDL